ncbi:MAG: isochorismatase family protein [Pseudomonadota bacterium]
MTSVIDFFEFKSQTIAPTLVLVGLHQNPDGSSNSLPAYRGALSNCRAVLDRARASNIPVAYARNIAPKSMNDRLHYPSWIPGFEPVRSDMIFDVLQPSCYSNTEFARAMEYTNGNFAIAGLFAETTCLSTAIDAYHRRHDFTYLFDASACRNIETIPAAAIHGAVSQVMSAYGKIMEGSQWSLSLPSRRRAM